MAAKRKRSRAGSCDVASAPAERFLLHENPHGGAESCASFPGAAFRVHLLFPNTYALGMANLGFQYVFRRFAECPDTSVERVFVEDRKAAVPPRTFESGRHISDCDLIAAALSFEGDFPQLTAAMYAAGVLRKPCGLGDPPENDQLPLLMAGGIAATLNPEPLSDFFDLFVIGEADELIAEVVSHCLAAKQDQTAREDMLLQLADVEGVYVPRFFVPRYSREGFVTGHCRSEGVSRQPRRRTVPDISKFPVCTAVLAPESEFGSMFMVETGRGCEMGCRFCISAFAYRPVRRRSESSLTELVEQGLQHSDTIGFVGAAASSHPSVERISNYVAEEGGRAAMSSIMAQRMTSDFARSLKINKVKSIALAPEAGSESLRFSVGKRVPDSAFESALRSAAAAGVSHVKLYFMVGLPGETDDDVDAIAGLAERLYAVMEVSATNEASESSRQPRLTVSVSPFIPKPWTPFQWQPMNGLKQLRRKLQTIKKLVHRVKGVAVTCESAREATVQALLARADRRLGEKLYHMAEQGYSWRWLLKAAASGESEPLLDFYVWRLIPYEEYLPWNVIDMGISKGLLKREAQRSKSREARG